VRREPHRLAAWVELSHRSPSYCDAFGAKALLVLEDRAVSPVARRRSYSLPVSLWEDRLLQTVNARIINHEARPSFASRDAPLSPSFTAMDHAVERLRSRFDLVLGVRMTKVTGDLFQSRDRSA